MIFIHPTTIGIRRYQVERTALARREIRVETPWGPAKAKMCIRDRPLYLLRYCSANTRKVCFFRVKRHAFLILL